jgi:hypothetical protein
MKREGASRNLNARALQASIERFRARNHEAIQAGDLQKSVELLKLVMSFIPA